MKLKSSFTLRGCGGRDLNPRIPTEQDLKSCAFGHARLPPRVYFLLSFIGGIYK